MRQSRCMFARRAEERRGPGRTIAMKGLMEEEAGEDEEDRDHISEIGIGIWYWGTEVSCACFSWELRCKTTREQLSAIINLPTPWKLNLARFGPCSWIK